MNDWDVPDEYGHTYKEWKLFTPYGIRSLGTALLICAFVFVLVFVLDRVLT